MSTVVGNSQISQEMLSIHYLYEKKQWKTEEKKDLKKRSGKTLMEILVMLCSRKRKVRIKSRRKKNFFWVVNQLFYMIS